MSKELSVIYDDEKPDCLFIKGSGNMLNDIGLLSKALGALCYEYINQADTIEAKHIKACLDGMFSEIYGTKRRLDG